MEIKKPDSDELMLSLVREFHHEKLHVPAIQRGEVWTTVHLSHLLNSIIQDFPIGTVFIWDEKEKTENLEEDALIPKSWILDGQQRISSLRYLLYFQNRSNSRIKLDQLYFDLWRNEVFLSKEVKEDSNILPIKEIFKGDGSVNSNLADWKSKIGTINNGNKRAQNVSTFLEKLQKLTVTKIVISTTQGSRNDYKQLANLFVTINNSGKLLTKNEVVLAKLMGHMRDIEKSVASIVKSIAKHQLMFDTKLNLSETENQKKWILGLISVYCTDGKMYHTTKNPVLIEQPLESVADSFSKAKSAIDLALDTVCRAKIHSYKLVPSTTWVLLAYILKKYKLNENFENQEKINRFIYVSLLTRNFAETSMDSALYEISQSVTAQEAFERVIKVYLNLESGLPLIVSDIKDIKYNASFAKALKEITLATTNLSDWGDFSQKINQSFKSSTYRIEDHHIFPKAKLKEMKVTSLKEINSLANITFIYGITNNQKINDNAPKIYLPKIEQDILIEHFVPLERDFWEDEGYYDFLTARSKLWIDHINKVLDIQPQMNNDIDGNSTTATEYNPE